MRTFAMLAATLLLLGAVYVANRVQPSLAETLPAADLRGAPLRLLVFFQEEDCDGSLLGMRVIAHPSLAEHISVEAFLVSTGSRADIDEIRRSVGDVPVTVLTRVTRRALLPLGYSRTPFVVVLDRAGRIRITAPLPQDEATVVALVDQVMRTKALNVRGQP